MKTVIRKGKTDFVQIIIILIIYCCIFSLSFSSSQSQVKDWMIQTVEMRAAVGVKRPMCVKSVVLSSLSGLISVNI